jgi:RNA polymerase sigma factor (TIGR02999 family)
VAEFDQEGQDLTVLLSRIRDGDGEAERQFYAIVYDELRNVAARLVARNHHESINATIVVNELFIRISSSSFFNNVVNRRYFFAAATDQMRKLLIDYQRRKVTERKGGKVQISSLDEGLLSILEHIQNVNQLDVEDLDAALAKLKVENERQYQVVVLRFYGGRTNDEIAELLDVSTRTVQNDWRVARSKLYLELK